ncbi:hypothetical protein SAMN04515674_101473 [Pseudarcicella hirudinis]|uniref:Uncharacterized protein n=1 Tax=Pseudarcicella hirudinis TaxID=1079859 RepID=A0A1I5MW18_9BACT|nr:DUF777 family protein [Pseudarcicella hirudinis]SFP13698.1 hypothetical protein SAMN04515674_101473 [Pseudarcicella hirudinis]
MENAIQQMRTALAEHVQSYTTIQVLTGIVQSVTDTTADVTEEGSPDIVHTVELSASPDTSEGFWLIPAVGSKVLLGRIENGEDFTIVKFDKVDKLVYNVSNTRIEATGNGVKILSGAKVQIANTSQSLAGIFGDLISLLNGLKVICSSPGAPSSALSPDTIVSITSLQTKINSLFE